MGYAENTDYVGTTREIQDLWLYFLLDQILPVSFTINLFVIALLLTAPKPSDYSPTVLWSTPKPFHQVIPLAAYFLALAVAPYTKDSSALMPLVLATRFLLFYPYLGFRPKILPSIKSQISGSDDPKSKDPNTNLLRQYKPSVLTFMLGYVLLRVLHILGGSGTAFPTKRILMAVDNDYAVRTLGCDFVMAMVSLGVWDQTRPKSKPRRE